MFNKYQKASDSTKILFMYLLLNGYDIKNVEYIVEEEESRLFGLKIKKVYGITKDFVDVKRIEKEIDAIPTPIICSPLSFEYYSDANIIHAYEAELKDSPLWINDLSIISPIMVISENRVISNCIAKPLAETDENGFMFFYDYVLREECVVGKWRMVYSDKVFTIYYTSSDKHGNPHEELMYSAIEIDKTSTYKLVIYVIKKASMLIDDWLPDNFVEQTYELVVSNEHK